MNNLLYIPFLQLAWDFTRTIIPSPTGKLTAVAEGFATPFFYSLSFFPICSTKNWIYKKFENLTNVARWKENKTESLDNTQWFPWKFVDCVDAFRFHLQNTAIQVYQSIYPSSTEAFSTKCANEIANLINEKGLSQDLIVKTTISSLIEKYLNGESSKKDYSFTCKEAAIISAQCLSSAFQWSLRYLAVSSIVHTIGLEIITNSYLALGAMAITYSSFVLFPTIKHDLSKQIAQLFDTKLTNEQKNYILDKIIKVHINNIEEKKLKEFTTALKNLQVENVECKLTAPLAKENEPINEPEEKKEVKAEKKEEKPENKNPEQKPKESKEELPSVPSNSSQNIQELPEDQLKRLDPTTSMTFKDLNDATKQRKELYKQLLQTTNKSLLWWQCKMKLSYAACMEAFHNKTVSSFKSNFIDVVKCMHTLLENDNHSGLLADYILLKEDDLDAKFKDLFTTDELSQFKEEIRNIPLDYVVVNKTLIN